jgi:hypothetical protein
MPKTRSRKYKNKTSKKCEYQSTTQGLVKWYIHLFEKLGWIVLANKHGMKFKVDNYKQSIRVLKEKIECKLNTIHDIDKRIDLTIILKNVIILDEHVRRDFN